MFNKVILETFQYQQINSQEINYFCPISSFKDDDLNKLQQSRQIQKFIQNNYFDSNQQYRMQRESGRVADGPSRKEAKQRIQQKDQRIQQKDRIGDKQAQEEVETPVPIKKKSDITVKQAEEFVKKIHSQIKPKEWIRNNYYQKLGLDLVNKQQQQNLQKQQSYQNDNYNIDIFTPRTTDQIRNRYLSKLNIYGNENQQSHNTRKRHQHFFIFDWDDTLLCTSFLSSNQFQEINNDAKNLLKKLDDTSSSLLSKVIIKGQNYIITNAAKGWVQYSSKLYLPKTHEIVVNSNIKIYSARSMYGQEYPGDFGRWKMQAFKSILSNVDKYLVTNLICIGDSNIQMEAAHCVGRQFYHGLVKTIKFRENPKPDQLIKQQQLVIDKLNYIFQETKNLTIRLERKGK